MRGLTERQEKVLEYIVEYQQHRGYPPTIREIGQALGIRSTNGVNDHLKALERKGCIVRDVSKSRAIVVMDVEGETADAEWSPRTPRSGVVPFPEPETSARRSDQQDDTLRVPLLGDIAAGEPIESIEHAERMIAVDPSLLGPRRAGSVFALRVQGRSMVNVGIHDGDILFVRSGTEARDGEIVAVMVDGSATVKRLRRVAGGIRLDPENDEFSPIFVPAGEATTVRVLGRVAGLYRELDG